MEINVTINGQPLTWQVNPGEILLDVLRREGYLSVKWGCGEGDCGACTILVDGQSMRSCLMLKPLLIRDMFRPKTRFVKPWTATCVAALVTKRLSKQYWMRPKG